MAFDFKNINSSGIISWFRHKPHRINVMFIIVDHPTLCWKWQDGSNVEKQVLPSDRSRTSLPFFFLFNLLHQAIAQVKFCIFKGQYFRTVFPGICMGNGICHHRMME